MSLVSLGPPYFGHLPDRNRDRSPNCLVLYPNPNLSSGVCPTQRRLRYHKLREERGTVATRKPNPTRTLLAKNFYLFYHELELDSTWPIVFLDMKISFLHNM
jgi:hypothetical protein